MHDARVQQEVQASGGVAREELVRWKVAFPSIARPARGHDVARRVRAATRERLHVIQRSRFQVERHSAVHAAPAAVAQRRTLERPLVRGVSAGISAAGTDGKEPRQSDAVNAPDDEAMMRHL